MSEEKQTVQFHYIKSNFFRVAHVDGAIGGITPSGLIFISLYSERAALPQVMVHEITETGQIGAERSEDRQSKVGIVREIELGATMHVDVAKALVGWLQEKIDLSQKLVSMSKQEEK